MTSTVQRVSAESATLYARVLTHMPVYCGWPVFDYYNIFSEAQADEVNVPALRNNATGGAGIVSQSALF